MAAEKQTKEQGELSKRIGDFLSERTRDSRKMLVAISSLRLAIDIGGYIPPEVLGLKLNEMSAGFIDKLFLALILYFLITFLVYSIADMRIWYDSLGHRGPNSDSNDNWPSVQPIINLSVEVYLPFALSAGALFLMMLKTILISD